MKFIPGSHKHALVAHVDTFDDNNLLSRGQEVTVEVDESKGVSVELETGQASMHHGHLFHASDANTTNDRRIGVAIRYIKPSMKQRTGDRSLVALVSGEDRHDNFTIAATPTRDNATDCRLLAMLPQSPRTLVQQTGCPNRTVKKHILYYFTAHHRIRGLRLVRILASCVR